jgi:hypothetical protein
MNWDEVVRCAHGTLRAKDYDDESCRWEIECADCGEIRRLTQKEWRHLLISPTPSRELIEITDHPLESGGVESGRYSLV